MKKNLVGGGRFDLTKKKNSNLSQKIIIYDDFFSRKNAQSLFEKQNKISPPLRFFFYFDPLLFSFQEIFINFLLFRIFVARPFVYVVFFFFFFSFFLWCVNGFISQQVVLCYVSYVLISLSWAYYIVKLKWYQGNMTWK